MMTSLSLLVVSNGRGEDAVGAAIVSALSPHVNPIAFPLVGMGEAYGGITLLQPRRDLPSGGFGFRGSISGLIGDLQAGIVRLWRQQRRTLRRQRGAHSAVIAVGDVYCLWMAAQAGLPCTFVATAKSAFNERHRALEVHLMRRYAVVVFTRDASTAEELRAREIPARFDGNPLMDTVPSPWGAIPVPRDTPIVLLLPGSRSDAVRNALLLLKSTQRVRLSINAAFVCALPSIVSVEELHHRAAAEGWRPEGSSLRWDQTTVALTHDFGSALRVAAVAIGLAGTANEQAAGMGVPVIAFSPPRAVQYTAHFLHLQRRLLGEALIATSGWESAADTVLRLLRDPAERHRRGMEGRHRMGPAGAVDAIRNFVQRHAHDSGVSDERTLRSIRGKA